MTPTFKVCTSREIEPDFVSTKIMEFTKADFSHIFILVNDKTIYQATGKGFHTVPLEEFMVGHVIVGEKKIEVPDPSYALGWLEGNLGKGYGHLQYVGFLAPALQDLFDNNKGLLICSESVILFVEECAKRKLRGNADYLSPKDVWELI